MKTRAMIIAVLLCSVAAQAQEWEVPSFNEGNIRVYTKVHSDERNIITETRVNSTIKYPSVDEDTIGYRTSIGYRDFDLIYNRGPIRLDNSNVTRYYGALYLNEDGVVMAQQGYANNPDIYPWYVAVPPTVDTLYVRDSSSFGSNWTRYTDFRTFDTTVFQTLVHALSYKILDGYETRVIVAERFGLVRMVVPYCEECEWFLSGAVLDGVAYDLDIHRFEFPAPCPDMKLEYKVRNTDGATYHSITTARDSVINDTTYHVIRRPGYNMFRIENDQIIARSGDVEYVVPPLDVSLGTIIDQDYMVTGLFNVLINAELKRGFTMTFSGNDVGSSISWVEDVGLFRDVLWSWYSGTDSEWLVNLTNCGTSYTITGIDSPPAPPSSPRIFSAPYPNPVSLGQGSVALTSTQQLTQPVYITLSDLLGRKRYTLRLEPTGPGTALRIPLRDIGPGLYYLSLNGATFSETTKLVVVK